MTLESEKPTPREKQTSAPAGVKKAVLLLIAWLEKDMQQKPKPAPPSSPFDCRIEK